MKGASDIILYLKEDISLVEAFDCNTHESHESVYSSPSLLNEYLWYDKLWGPSQRVVTLFTLRSSVR